jgi:tetratricopeptide (TPR) repeat protein
MSIDSLQSPEASSARRHAAVAELEGLIQSHAAARHWASMAETAAVILQLEPDHQGALYAHAAALISQKEITFRAKARESLERLMTLNPRHYEAAFALADVYLAIGPYESAKPLLSRLLKELPANTRVQALVGDLNARLAEALMVPEKVEAGAAPRGRRVNRARYPDHVSDFDDLRAAVKKHVIGASEPADRFLAPDARGFTMGSCFAGRIARELDRLGQPTLFLQLAETVNTTHANLEFLRWLSKEDDGSCAAYFERELQQRGHTRESVRESLSRAHFVVYTLGVAPAFFHRETGKFRPHEPQDFKQFEFLRDYVYRTTTVEENVANLRAIRELLRKAQTHREARAERVARAVHGDLRDGIGDRGGLHFEVDASSRRARIPQGPRRGGDLLALVRDRALALRPHRPHLRHRRRQQPSRFRCAGDDDRRALHRTFQACFAASSDRRIAGTVARGPWSVMGRTMRALHLILAVFLALAASWAGVATATPLTTNASDIWWDPNESGGASM